MAPAYASASSGCPIDLAIATDNANPFEDCTEMVLEVSVLRSETPQTGATLELYLFPGEHEVVDLMDFTDTGETDASGWNIYRISNLAIPGGVEAEIKARFFIKVKVLASPPEDFTPGIFQAGASMAFSSGCSSLTAFKNIFTRSPAAVVPANTTVNISQLTFTPGAGGTDLVVNGTLVIDQSYVFTNGRAIAMGPGAKIEVPNRRMLSIITQSRVLACAELWESIDVKTGGSLLVDQATISDGEYAITANKGSKVSVTNTTFLNNRVGLYLPPGASATPGANIAAFWGNTLSAPALRTRDDCARGFAGVEVHDAGIVDLSGTEAAPNVYSELENGILAYDTDVIAYGSRFLGMDIPGGDCTVLSPAADNNWYGRGIYIQGLTGSPAVLMQRGFGKDGDVSFSGAATGIQALRANVFSSDNNMSGLLRGYEIRAADKGVRIEDNTLADVQLGISMFQNTARCLISGNDIDPRLYEDCAIGNCGLTGIRMNEHLFSGSDWEDYQVTDNLITHGSLAGAVWPTGIQLWSGSSINISQNTVMLSSSDAPAFGPYAGLQAATVRGLIGCNDLTVSQAPVGAFSSCLNVLSDASSLLTCNYLDGGTVGLRVAGTNANTALKGNIFNTHTVGLQVRDALGQQIHHGNRWLDPAPQGGWQAQHLSSDLDVIEASRFVVDGEENPEFLPTQVNEAFWFSVQADTAITFTCEFNNTCPNGIGAMRHLWETGPSDHAIAADTIAFDRYKEEQTWQAARHLYGRIMDFGIPVPAYSALDTFVQNAQSSSIADFYEAEQKIRAAIVPDAVLDSVVLAREEAKMADMEQLYVLDSLAHSKSGMDSIGYLLAKLDLLDDIRGQKALLDSLHEAIGTLRDTATAEAQQWVDGIVIAEPYEQDLKTVMGLFLHYTVEGKAYSAAQEETLYNIAAQCPLKGSDAIFLARSLYATLDPEATYDDEALCAAVPELRGLPSGTTLPMEVFPNPARGRAVVNSGWAEAESARLTVYNSLGVPVLQVELPLFGGQGEVDLSQLPSGWYSLLLQAEGERKVARLVIAR